MENLELFAEWIKDSIKGIRKKEVKILGDIAPLELAYKTAIGLQPSIINFRPVTQTACAIGKLVLVGLEDPESSEKVINVTRFKVGWHLINLLSEKRKIELYRGRFDRDAYLIKALDDEFIDTLFWAVDINPLPDVPIYTRPSFKRPKAFTSFYHDEAGELVRKTNREAREHFSYDECPKVFDAINKHMQMGYVVNTELLDVYRACEEDDIFTLNDKENTLTEEQLVGMRREITQTLTIAKGIGDRRFWEYMFYDNRGRMYSSSVYFTHQGSKLAKSLFKMHLMYKRPIRREGWFWLLVHAANCFGYDKDTIDKRFEFAEKQLPVWMEWANDPVNNKSWQNSRVVDSPFEFLAAILEIKNALALEDKYSYSSNLLVAWDATCSGLQVLAAISRDSKAAELCNLTDTLERSDYYRTIANHVWKDTSYTKQEEEIFLHIDKQLNILNNNVNRALKSNSSKETRKRRIKEAIEKRKVFVQDNKKDIYAASKVFWGRQEIYELRRKIVKRPCMTYFYSCGARTMADQLYDDFKDEFEFKGLQKSYCFWLTNRIFKACKDKMPIPTRMMEVMIELGIKAYRDNKDFSIQAPFNKFMLVQNYRKNKLMRIKIHHKRSILKFRLIVGKMSELHYQKIKSATSPNVVHMLDSQIVSYVLCNTNYNVVCIHDSFSTIPADAGKLFEDTRTSFVNLFKGDVLNDMLEQKNYEEKIELGDYDINETIANEFCFS